MKLSKIIGYTFVLSVVSVTALGLIFQRDIQDYLQLRNYQPSQEVVQLANATTMLDSSRRVFYVNKPVIADPDIFNEHCRDNEYSIVLGCYHSGQRGIYILDVDDTRLSGIKEVTAAHELLHAAYERLGSKERQAIDELTRQAFDGQEDTRIIETVESYRKQDPNIVPGELHSILGTEVRNLPESLEAHYAKYFKDRKQVVALSEKYEQAFIDRRNAIREFEVQLTGLKAEIDSLRSKLDRDNDELLELRNKLTQLRQDNKVEEYNSLLGQYRSRVSTFNQGIDNFNSLVVKYNGIAQQYSQVQSERIDLIKAIDSREIGSDSH